MRNMILGFIASLAMALVLVGCGGPKVASGGPPTLAMDMSNFTGATTVTIKAGASVTFTDSASGSTHLLVTGTQGQTAAEAGAPTELTSASGFEIDKGKSVSITFPTAGTYHITCTVHPAMNATVIVQ